MDGEQQDRNDAPLLIGGMIAGCCALLVVLGIGFVLVALFGIRPFGFP